MSGLITLSARLSNGNIISSKINADEYLGARTLTDEDFLLKIFKEELKSDLKRFIPFNIEKGLDVHSEFKSGDTLIAPYHHGICFVDFIDNTIDYYNMESQLFFVNKTIIEWEMLELFEKYKKYFNDKRYRFDSIISQVLDNDFSYISVSNFAYALDNGWLKSVGRNNIIDNDCMFSFNDLSKSFFEKNSATFPEFYKLFIPNWKVYSDKTSNKDSFNIIKNNIYSKNILNEYDIHAWEHYEKEIFII